MTIQRMDHVGIVVDDLAAAVAFFAELGLELEGETTVEGRSVDRVVGLDGVQSDIALVVVDDLGREVRATMPRMHSFIGSGSREAFWGFEGVGEYVVEGVGPVSGLSSYFWPGRVTPRGLQSGEWR